MKTEDWKRVKELLQEVLPLAAAEREQFLDDTGIAADIRSEVASLLAFEEESEDMMRLSAYEFSKDFFDEEATENDLIGQKFGVYEIVREIGYGGMGVVYLARRSDGKFNQKVALKLLKREMNTSQLRRRFRQEREILASLEHPNIARLLDAGTTDDKIPYIAMEFIEGVPIDDYCHRENLDLTARLGLFRTVCRSIDYAHRNLVVHRDLKPSNILITPDGVPKLLDFGISKILSADFENADSATVTKLGAMTPAYASPEQMRNESVTTSTDIYSLGVILYELLSGHRPFEQQEANLKDIYQAVLETDPPPPSSMIDTVSKSFKKITDAKTEVKKDDISDLSTIIQSPDHQTAANKFPHTLAPTVNLSAGSLRGDLDNIVLKALKKEPERRYSSAGNFSEDIQRHLDGLPVTARPDTFSYRAEKFIKRNSISVLAGTLILLAVIGGVIATLWQAQIAKSERAKAEQRFNDVRTLANSFLFEFSPKIENLPGSMPARQLLVTRALEYLDNLSKESADDFELQRELAAAYEKVGDVQGHPFNPNTGDIKGALQSYDKARAIRLKLLEAEPSSLQAQSDLAKNYEMTGGIQANGGEYAQGVTNYDQALAIREQILNTNPQDFEARAKFAGIINSRGLIPLYEYENKKAIEYFDRAGAIYEQLHLERPDDTRVADAYAMTFVNRSEALGWDGDTEGAIAASERALQIFIPLHEKNPNDHGIRRGLMLAYSKNGIAYEDAKDYERSMAAYGKSMEIAQAALKADPLDVQAKRDLGIGYKKLAQVMDSAGKSAESVEKLTVALKLFQELAQTDPNNSEALYDIANTRFSIAETYTTMKDYEKALETYRTAKEEFQKVLAINPKNLYAIRVSAFTSDGIGKSSAALAEKRNDSELRREALKNIRVALEMLNGLKAEGKLAEYDFESVAEMETQIAQLESKVAGK